MREIKFRAWDIYFEQMFDVIRIDWLPHGMNVYLDDAEESCSDGCELMQYTGLLDKNGKEISEGDIVKAWICYGPGGEVKQIFEVKIGAFGVNIEEWNYKENVLPEVIGNIYENPELVK